MPLLFTCNPPVLDVDTAQTSLLQRIYVDVCEGIFAAHTHTHISFFPPIWQKPESNFEMSHLTYNPPKEFAMQIPSAVWFTAHP